MTVSLRKRREIRALFYDEHFPRVKTALLKEPSALGHMFHELFRERARPSDEEMTEDSVVIEQLIQAMKFSPRTTFIGFIESISDQPDLSKTYQSLEAELFPGFAYDWGRVFKQLEAEGENPLEVIPPQYKKYFSDILSLNGTSRSRLLWAFAAFATGSTTFALTSALVEEMEALPFFAGKMLTVAPMMLGGGLRVWSAHEEDRMHGERAVKWLLGASVLGLAVVAMMTHYLDVSEIEASEPAYFGLLGATLFVGFGVCAFCNTRPAFERIGK